MRLAAVRLRQLRVERFRLVAVARKLTRQCRLRDAHALARTGAENRRRPRPLTFWLIRLRRTSQTAPPRRQAMPVSRCIKIMSLMNHLAANGLLSFTLCGV